MNAATRGFQALLGERRWQELLRLGDQRRYESGSYLLQQGGRGGSLLALTAGRVKVLGGEANGSELLLALRGAGDLIGEMAARSDAVRSATVRAVDNCTARYLSTTTFNQFLAARELHGVLNDYLVAKLSETVPYQVQLVHFSPRQRVARLLLEVVALAKADHPDRMKVPFSQEAIATALGLARSTVAEQITVLRKDGALTGGPRLTVADTGTLGKHAGI